MKVHKGLHFKMQLFGIAAILHCYHYIAQDTFSDSSPGEISQSVFLQSAIRQLFLVNTCVETGLLYYYQSNPYPVNSPTFSWRISGNYLSNGEESACRNGTPEMTPLIAYMADVNNRLRGSLLPAFTRVGRNQQAFEIRVETVMINYTAFQLLDSYFLTNKSQKNMQIHAH